MEQPRKPLRIAVSGYVGTGKTTFCEALAGSLDAPMIAEGMDGLLAAENAYHAAVRVPSPDRPAVAAARERLLGAFAEWAKRREALCARETSFVADRWEADLLVWWLTLLGGSGMAVDRETMTLLRDLRARASRLTHVIVMPFQKPFPGQRNSDGMVRRADFTTQALYEATLAGVIASFAGIRAIRLPAGAVSVEQRVDQALRALGVIRP
ncbi:MAG: AAA family ATPase [Novosphingobium sp.]|nr:AAA family ATPase [Novosphingobium sp.]